MDKHLSGLAFGAAGIRVPQIVDPAAAGVRGAAEPGLRQARAGSASQDTYRIELS